MNSRSFSKGKACADSLTWREQDVLMLLAERLTNHEIADRLHLAESTVKDYVGSIISKLYVKNRREAVERAKAMGLLDSERKTAEKPPTSLPIERTPFIGRRDELMKIMQYLGETRLLTLVGPGGIGKTRLAVKAAEGTANDFKNGVFFVALAPIHKPEHILQKIAEALKFPLTTHEEPQLQLLRYLRKRQLLLVMDNFEHLLDGIGIISEILQEAPAVKILATSRERLNLQSETILSVGGMSFPDQAGLKDTLAYDSINLFMQRANKVRPGFTPTADELEQIADICQMVEGMPLAIELAAAWLHILNVDEIASELEKSLDILSTEMHDAPHRHRSIRTVFDHTWSMLDEIEQDIFIRLSVFRGGFTRDAARQVAGASLQHLMGLVNKSLLNHDPDCGRLEVHELLRQYAHQRLEQMPAASLSTHEAHAAYFAAFMQQKWAYLKCNRQMTALAEIETDIENVRAAWRYGLDHRNTPQLWKFIKGLWHVYWIRSWNHAGAALFAEAARVSQGIEDDEMIALRALAMAYQSYFMAFLGIPEQGYQLAVESVSILKQGSHPDALWFAYDSLALNAYFLNRLTEQINATNKLVEIAAEINDPWLTAFMLFAPSMVALRMEDYAKARRLAEENLNLYEEIGDVIGSTMPLIILGHIALAQEEYGNAKEFYLRCLKISRRTGFNYSTQTASKYLGKVTLLMGKYVESENYLIACLTLTREVGFVRDIINLLYEIARLMVVQGNSERAAELLAFVIQHPTSSQIRWLEGRIRDSAQDLLAQT